MSRMELALDPGDQDPLGFLVEESGNLGAEHTASDLTSDWEQPLSEVCGGRGWVEMSMRGEGGEKSRPVTPNPLQALSDWDVEDFLISLLSPPASLNVLSSSNPCIVHHDHTYSLPHEHDSIDIGESKIRDVLEEKLMGLAIHTSSFCR